MKSIKSKLASLFHGEEGPSPVEYSVLLTLLVVASLTCIGMVQRTAPPYLTQIPSTQKR
jgi:Flp pilus assembly pilin Flp